MKPKFFRKLRVFGIQVGVYKLPGLMAEGLCGYYESESKKITVEAELKGDALELTIIHEMFHAVLDRLHCQQQMPPEFAEVIVENLARAVLDNYQVKRRN